MKKVILLFTLFLGMVAFSNAQTVEELKAQKAEKNAQIATLQGEANAIQGQLDALPGWRKGAFGTIGLNLSGFNNWLQKADPNSSATTIGISGNAFANLIQDKYFWRNSANLNLGWLKFNKDTDNEANDDLDFEETADVLSISSLFGYRLNDKWAASVLGEYRTSILSNFNNPGYFDIGAGATWTPMSNLVVVIHPLNYNFVFADDDVVYESSLGAKIVADYSQSLPMGVAWKSNLSAFLSYSDPSDFSNWTWVNGFSFTAWKGIGVGFELGLRGNKQESYNAKLAGDETLTPEDFKIGDLDGDDNDIQSYWLIGLSYNISK